MNIDLQKIDADIQSALPQHVEVQTAKANEKIAAFGALSLPSAGTIDEVKVTLCSHWPQFRDTVNMALGLIGWFMPTQVAVAKAIMASLDKNVVTPICAVK